MTSCMRRKSNGISGDEISTALFTNTIWHNEPVVTMRAKDTHDQGGDHVEQDDRGDLYLSAPKAKTVSEEHLHVRRCQVGKAGTAWPSARS